MTTLEQMPSGPQVTVPQEMEVATLAANPLNSLLARAYTLNWEAIFYLGLFVVAILTRFTGLGDRVASHDESLHMKYSFGLYANGDFAHTPLMHGPLLFHGVALMYLLFGANDFTARLYPAILGTIMIFMPRLLFQRWLGRFGAMVAGVLILISPMLLFHARYIREDTPAIFFTILMVYAIFAYINGTKPRQGRYLILLAAATLLGLASKETGFMYIAVFGALLTLFLVLQVIQGWRSGVLDGTIGYAVFGVIAMPTAGVISAFILFWLKGKLNLGTPAPLNIGPITIRGSQIGPLIISPGVQSVLVLMVIGLPLALLIAGAAFFVARLLWTKILHRPGPALVNLIGSRANSLFRLAMAGAIIGTVAALAFTVILNIIPPDSINTASTAWATYDKQAAQPVAQGQTGPTAPTDPRPEVLTGRLALWSGLTILVLAALVIIPALIGFRRFPRFPWADIAIVALAAIMVGTILVYAEERSRNIPTPAATAVYNDAWIQAPWVIAGVCILGLLALRFGTTFFQQMRRYPAFDLLVVLGTLILPWLAAYPIWRAGYPLDANTYSPEIISACILGVIPFIAVGIVFGLCWEPALWVICAATFYALFAFFYTTIFTNVNGLATGAIGSLGYWLTQQGVRRGSQPQYYYLLIELPIYEYLPVIGAAVAGVVGMFALWRFRAERMLTSLQAQTAAADAAAMHAEAVDGTETNAEASVDNSMFTTVAYPAAVYDNPTAMAQTVAAESAEPLPDAATSAEPITVEPASEPAPATFGSFLGKFFRRDTPALALVDNGTVPEAERLDTFPFLGFVGCWAVLIIMALTMAGEKMPWLTTHMTVPLILLTGWFIGTQLEKVNWNTFWRQSWVLIILLPVLLIGLANVIGPFLLRKDPNTGLTRDAQLQTFAWMGAVLLAAIVIYAIYRVWRRIGTQQLVRVSIIGVFVLLGVMTARIAWMAAYINYDQATEFMVYAHGAPAYKTVTNYLLDIAHRTTDGMNIHFAYDDAVSWPGSWYWRNEVWPKAHFLGDASNPGDLSDNLVIVVSKDHSQKLDAQLLDKYVKQEVIRMWWPMQDYFDLNTTKIDNALGNADIRQGIWNIWWNRDYNAYAKATGNANRFDLDQWPVSDHFVYYVRKDIAAQLWDFGTGSAKVTGLPPDAFANLRCDTCQAAIDFHESGAKPFNSPRGMTVGPDGKVYIADSQNTRIVVMDHNGVVLHEFGVPSPTDPQNAIPALGTFREPWSVAVDKDGTMYIADTWNHRIQVLSKDGTPLRSWGKFEHVDPGVAGSTDGFYGPRDIKIDSTGHLYVADTGNKRIRVYDTQGTFLYNIGAGGTSDTALNEPVGLAIREQANELFVADTWNRRIMVFNLQDGTFLRKWDVQAWVAMSPSTDNGNRPFLALDKTGNFLFVTDPDTGRVLVYSPTGNAVLTFGRLHSASDTTQHTNEFGILGGVAFDPTTGELYLVDTGETRVVRFDANAFPGLKPPVDIVAPPSGQDQQPTGAATAGVF